MTDATDPPIEEPGFLHGVTVVDIGDYRVSRGLTRRTFSGCHHHRLTYDQNERRVWCRDCERDVEAFDAFLGLVKHFANAQYSLKREREKLEEAMGFQVRSLAAKAIDKAWRRKKMIPACPHCGHGLFPEDFKNGIAMLGRKFAEAMRKRNSTRGGNMSTLNDKKNAEFAEELMGLINKHSLENTSNTPDFILAGFIVGCLNTFEASIVTRDKWKGETVETEIEGS